MVATMPMRLTRETVKTATNTPPLVWSEDISLDLGNAPKLTYRDAHDMWHTDPMLGPDRALTDNDARRIVAVMADGQVIPLSVTGLGRNNIGEIGLVFDSFRPLHNFNRDIDLAKVKEFRLQTRPYHWAEFSDIALNPKT
jgi:hypothetical protein